MEWSSVGMKVGSIDGDYIECLTNVSISTFTMILTGPKVKIRIQSYSFMHDYHFEIKVKHVKDKHLYKKTYRIIEIDVLKCLHLL